MKSAKNKNDILLEMRIMTLYNSFQQFIDCKSMPKLKIKLIPWQERITSLRRMTFSNIKMLSNGLALLETVKENPKIMGDGLMAHYYHEFTHIYDDVTISSDFDLEIPSIKLYTEFHAEQVELKAALGFTSEIEDRKVALSETLKINVQLENVSKPLSLGDYLNYLTVDQKRLIPEWIEAYKQERIDNADAALLELFRSFLNSSTYYLSTVHFARKYCTESVDELVDVNIYDSFMGSGLQEAFAVLGQEQCTKEHLILLSEKQDKIRLDFVINISSL